MSEQRTVFPFAARQIAEMIGRSPGDCLVAGGIHFYYRRGPHLSPPHQIHGLSRRFIERTLTCFGLPVKRHAASDADAGIRVLQSAAHPTIVETVEGVWWVDSVDVDRLQVVTEESMRSVTVDTFVEAWMAAVPTGIWYEIDWQAATAPDPDRERERLWQALRDTAYDMLVCSGAWQGIDGIESFSEDLSRWTNDERWPASAITAATAIRTSDGLWRSAYRDALFSLCDRLDFPTTWTDELTHIADRWHLAADILHAAGRTADADRLTTLRSRLLQLAADESRFWNHIVKRAAPHI